MPHHSAAPLKSSSLDLSGILWRGEWEAVLAGPSFQASAATQCGDVFHGTGRACRGEPSAGLYTAPIFSSASGRRVPKTTGRYLTTRNDVSQTLIRVEWKGRLEGARA